MTHDERLQVIRIMKAHGGTFVCALAELLAVADDVNAGRIEATWPSIIENHRRIAARMPKEPA